MKMVIAHHLYETKGGGERLCAVVIDEAVKRGHDVAIATTAKFNAQKTFRDNFGIRLNEEPTQFYLINKFFNLCGIFHRLFTYLPIRKALKNFRPESIFLDMEFIKPLERDIRKSGARVVRYVHFPTIAETSKRDLLPEKYFRFPYSWYWKLYLLFQQRVVLPKDGDFCDVVCANSEFTKKYVEKIWDTSDVEVVYPPISISQYSPSDKNEDSVVTLGRFTPEKRYEEVIQAISECESEVTLHMVGGLIPAMNMYFQKLKMLARKLGVGDRVHFYPNASFDMVRSQLGQAKVFVHPMRNEHFGMGTVEAMASGCVPVNHNSGGSVGILNKGKFGFLFNDPSEIATYIDRVMSDERYFKKMSAAVETRAQWYDESHFRQRILKLMT